MTPDMKWARISAAADNGPAELEIFGDIGESWFAEESITAKSISRELKPLAGRDLTVRINSYGGSVADGLAIYNALRRHAATAKVTTSVEGVAMSIATLIAMAGDTREMASNALYMVHAPWGVSAGNSKDMREMANVLDKYAEAMASAYARSALNDAEIKLLLTDGEDHFYNASEAEAAGFITAIVQDQDMAIAAAYSDNRFTQRHQPVAQATDPARAPITPKESTMTTANPKSGAEPVAENLNVASIEAAAQAKALEQIKARAGEIRMMFKPFMAREGIAELQDACLDDPSMSLDTVSAKLLTELGKDAAPIASNPRIEAGEDSADKFRAAASEAILVRAGIEKDAKVRAEIGQNPFRGSRLTDIARACLERSGIKTEGMSQIQMVGAAFTQGTSDFPVLLENTMHKALQAAYGATPLTWNRFCVTGSVSDFRAHNRYRVGSLSNLESVNELGEFRNKTIPDGEKSSVQVDTKGNIINLSRQAIINDDLGAFIGLSASLGRAAARTIEAAVYSLLAENSGLGPTMADGYTLFHANHSNISTAAALSMAAIDADRVAMALQMDVGGNDYIDLRPDVLLVPIALGGTARTINAAVYDPDTANKLQKPNMVNGLFSDIVDSQRINGTRRYVFTNPMLAPVIEVSFLDGNQTPYLEMKDGFDVDGAAWKVRLDFGVTAIDYRGAITNAGA